jgi:Tfp pilus assembly protein PilX
MKHLPMSLRRPSQRGAATLVVVMVLFLVMALLAAYANRSLMFEQRISGSYYRASLAQEMAEAGVDWTVAMLNGEATNTACQPVATGGTRFLDRYMEFSPADRAAKARSSTPTNLAADCVRGANGLVCRCPDPDTRTTQPATTVQGNLVPSFGLKMGTDATQQYSAFSVNSLGCTDSSVDRCTAGAEARSQGVMGAVELQAAIGFIGAVPSSPASPLTVKGRLTTAGTGGLGLHNTDPGTAGMLVISGGPAPALIDARMNTTPGTPPAQARLFNDSALLALGDTQFFQTYMGMTPGRYRNHPALREVACPAGGDCGPNLLAAYDAGRNVLWVQGPMQISSNVIIGTAARPLLIIANGAVTLSGAFELSGMIVSLGNLDWTNTSGLTSRINGMVLVQGDMTATGGMDIAYRQDIANQLRNRVGSFARVSGGMRDGTID